MIERLNKSNRIDFLDFMNRCKDAYEDFYFTIDTHRVFPKDLKNIDKLLGSQEIYGLNEKELKGILVIYRQKGFRPYVKLLAESYNSQKDLLTYLIYNFSENDLYFKLKKSNPLSKMLQRRGFVFIGNRGTFDKPGTEDLLFRKGEKLRRKLIAKDEFEN